LGIAALSLIAGCAAPAGEIKSDRQRLAPEATEAETAELVDGNNRFAFNLYQVVKNEPGNLFYSPYSISLALAMTYAGARNNTEAQMAEVLHYQLPQPQLHPTFNALDSTLTGYGSGAGSDQDAEAFQLNIANAIWGQEGYQFLQDFLDTLAENYGAGLRPLDFAAEPEAARATINDWVEEETNGKIENLIPPGLLSSAVRLVLTNAIYFNGQWVFQFEEGATQDDLFTLLDGSTVSVPMMSQTEYFRYMEGDGYQAVALPYQGAPMSMLLILPEEGLFEQIEEGFSPELIKTITDGFDSRSVALSMPKFTFESEFDLAQTMAAMGMPDAFGGEADFSGMTGERDLFISNILHKAFVDVDEAGTEAAAATAVVMLESASMPPEDSVTMKLDRPFLFLIQDEDTGTVLFAGRVLNPK
jgi:serpin B